VVLGDLMSALQAETAAPQLAWWQKMRWKQTSREEGLHAEQKLLALSK
jgi:hypothetical protein